MPFSESAALTIPLELFRRAGLHDRGVTVARDRHAGGRRDDAAHRLVSAQACVSTFAIVALEGRVG